MISSDVLTVPAAGQSLYGKSVGEMIGTDVKVLKNGDVIGTFPYVENFEKFSSNPEHQSGHFFPFKLTQLGETMTFKQDGVPTKENIPFEAENVFRIADPAVKRTVEVDGKEVVTFKFGKAALQQKQS